MKQVQLGRYLGRWKYTHEKNIKYFQVSPTADGFEITWGNSVDELNSWNKKILIPTSTETYKRILSKARAGYTLEFLPDFSEWNDQCYDEFPDITETLQLEKTEAKKRAPRVRKLTLLEWLSGAESIRENEIIENNP